MSDPAYYFQWDTKVTQEGYITFQVETDETQGDPMRYGPRVYYFMTPVRFRERVKQYILDNYSVTGITPLEYQEKK